MHTWFLYFFKNKVRLQNLFSGIYLIYSSYKTQQYNFYQDSKHFKATTNLNFARRGIIQTFPQNKKENTHITYHLYCKIVIK